VGLASPSDSEENDVDKNLILSSESEGEMDMEHKSIPKKRTRVSKWLGGSCVIVCYKVDMCFLSVCLFIDCFHISLSSLYF
jgi:hypothetical protein